MINCKVNFSLYIFEFFVLFHSFLLFYIFVEQSTRVNSIQETKKRVKQNIFLFLFFFFSFKIHSCEIITHAQPESESCLHRVETKIEYKCEQNMENRRNNTKTKFKTTHIRVHMRARYLSVVVDISFFLLSVSLFHSFFFFILLFIFYLCIDSLMPTRNLISLQEFYVLV